MRPATTTYAKRPDLYERLDELSDPWAEFIHHPRLSAIVEGSRDGAASRRGSGQKVIVARFRDAAGGTIGLTPSIAWGDGA